MTKKDKVLRCFDLISNDLDNTFIIMRLKLLALSKLSGLEDAQILTTKVLDPDNSNKLVLDFDFTGQDLKLNRELIEPEMRRSYINDLYFMAARGSIRLYLILKGENNDNPASHDMDFDKALELHNRSLSKEDKKFLDFFHNVRNSMIHYDGQYNIKNKLNFEFCNLKFITTDKNIGEQIFWNMETLLGLHKRLKSIYNFQAFHKSQSFQERLK